MSLADLSVPDVAVALRQGGFSAEELLDAHLARIAARDPALHAFVTVTEDLARAAARRADAELRAGTDRGPLHGIPFGIKDLIDLEGVPTRCGARFPAAPAERNAVSVERMLEAGAVPLGKLATYEFALVGPSFDGAQPPAVNPWNPARITGGSSSGSASAVAGGLVRLALGTDTGGSVRSPACYCGVVGLKPTYDAVPRGGVFPLSHSLDHVGPLAASVAEAAAGFAALSGRRMDLSPGIKGLCIGYARDWFAADPAAAPALVEAMDAAVSVLTLLGARVALIDLPDYALAEAAGAVILHAEALEVHRGRLKADAASYGRQARQSLAAGVVLKPREVELAYETARRLRAEFDERLEGFDAVVTANVLAVAPEVADFRKETAVWTAMRTLPFNVTGHPALAVPIGFDNGLPLGMQIVGARLSEPMLCRIGAAFETATDHSALRPQALA